jgi:hypothetical protein
MMEMEVKNTVVVVSHGMERVGCSVENIFFCTDTLFLLLLYINQKKPVTDHDWIQIDCQ